MPVIVPMDPVVCKVENDGKKRRILLVRAGDFFIYVYQLAELLSRNGHEVEVLNTSNAEPEPLYRDLIEKTRNLNVRCHLIKERAGWIERKAVALAFRLHMVTKLGAITPNKIRESRRALATSKEFDIVIAYDPPSLFLACNLFANDLSKIIEYSLEISDESHRDFQTSRTERSFRYFERSALPKIKALMIQDSFRAKVLLRNVSGAENVKTIFFPVAMNGPSAKRERNPQSDLEDPSFVHREAKVLFFGGLWSEDLLRELGNVSEHLGERQVLVVHGGRGTVDISPVAKKKLVLSTSPIPFDQVNDLIASADIGLAIYPNAESNSRCSAFSSEKVARYLQCGIPFIAFHNEDYAFLRSRTRCCELVRSYSEIPNAINTILENYTKYQTAASLAFERFYRLENTAQALLNEINEASPTHIGAPENNHTWVPTTVSGFQPARQNDSSQVRFSSYQNPSDSKQSNQ